MFEVMPPYEGTVEEDIESDAIECNIRESLGNELVFFLAEV